MVAATGAGLAPILHTGHGGHAFAVESDYASGEVASFLWCGTCDETVAYLA
jgi:hypothetical protein